MRDTGSYIGARKALTQLPWPRKLKPVLHILHVVPSYLPAVRYGGANLTIHAPCKALAARVHERHVFTTTIDGPGNSAVPIGLPVDVEGVQVRYFSCPLLR
jgi:hypothetical protein